MTDNAPQSGSKSGPPSDRILRAILSTIVAMACFAILNAMSKTLSTSGYPVMQVIWARYVFAFVFMLAISWKLTIAAFLVNEWRKGALFGLTPDEAFYVKCDRETNPAEGIDAGQVLCQIGVAPVKPAEFVIFQLSQFSGGTSLVAE